STICVTINKEELTVLASSGCCRIPTRTWKTWRKRLKCEGLRFRKNHSKRRVSSCPITAKPCTPTLSYDGLVESWPQITRLARNTSRTTPQSETEMFAK